MPKEIEAKFRIPNPDPLRARLRELVAQPLGRVLQTDRLFDTPQRSLLHAGCGLRVRHWQSLDADSRSGAILTFKGPRDPGALKARQETETSVADAAAAITILEQLGFREMLVYQKRRETWRLSHCAVTLDELPRLGWYCEIEGPTAESVHTARDQLRLTDSPPTDETYPHLTVQHGQTDAAGRRTLLFEP